MNPMKFKHYLLTLTYKTSIVLHESPLLIVTQGQIDK